MLTTYKISSDFLISLILIDFNKEISYSVICELIFGLSDLNNMKYTIFGKKIKIIAWGICWVIFELRFGFSGPKYIGQASSWICDFPSENSNMLSAPGKNLRGNKKSEG